MAYNQYTSQQINDFITQKGIGNDHWAQYNFLKQNNIDPAAFDAARELTPGTTSAWSANAQQQLAGPIAGTRELDTANPHMAYALTQQRGNTAGQADSMFGNSAGTSAAWAQQQGLTGFGAPASTATMPPIGGTAPPINNSPATPNPYLAPSTAGSTPATMPMTGGGNGTVAPDYMVASPYPGSQPRQRNPYLPAGGMGSNYGNDPRSGMLGNQGFGGLGDYLFQNPSTLAMGNEVTRGVMNALQRQALPAIRGNAMAAGTVGGSRQGVAEGLATGDAMLGLAGALARLYGDQFNQDRGYGLQSDALDFNIHRGNLQDMRTGQLDQLAAMGQIGQLNQQGLATATQARDRPFTDWQRFVGPASQMAGLGGSQTQNLQGNPWLSAIGGALAGYRMFGG